MIVVYDEKQFLHAPEFEFHRGKTVSPFENSSRIHGILRAFDEAKFGQVQNPPDYSEELLFEVHDQEFVEFLKSVHSEWLAEGADGEILPHVWPSRKMIPRKPESIFGKLGYYSFDASTNIVSGTWEAAWASARSAICATDVSSTTNQNTFALCRPPGHHAEHAAYGGYCFLNNAAVAAQRLRQLGAHKVAVLDVDYHHGNGTQDIFYDRGDVLFASLHAAPELAYPYFSGYESETGRDDGHEATINVCLPHGTDWRSYRDALLPILSRISAFGPDALVVSFGADTFEKDPISSFKLETGDFTCLGREISDLGIRTVVVMEGGYAVDALGLNVLSFISQFD